MGPISRIRKCLLSEWPLVSLILLTWNSRVDLERCLPSLMAQHDPNCEIIVATSMMHAKCALIDALLSGYFFRISQILSKKSGYLDHLDEVFLCLEIAYL